MDLFRHNYFGGIFGGERSLEQGVWSRCKPSYHKSWPQPTQLSVHHLPFPTHLSAATIDFSSLKGKVVSGNRTVALVPLIALIAVAQNVHQQHIIHAMGNHFTKAEVIFTVIILSAQ